MVRVIAKILLSTSFLLSGKYPGTTEGKDCPEGISYDHLYDAAYYEIAGMLETGDYDIKRATFLLEWAYLEGKPDYGVFCDSITAIANTLKTFVAVNKLDKNPIGKNIALFEFFSNPSPLNHYKPYVYDFNDFRGDEDFTNYFVLKLMDTHTGQCRSLPLLYKILSEEIGAESYIALGPDHSFIRHPNGEGGWMNVELTNHSLPREIFIIETLGITSRALESGIYMKPLDNKETILYLLSELPLGYVHKYDYDDFVLLCGLTCLEYDPNHLKGLMIKNNALIRKAIYFETMAVNSGEPPPYWLEDIKKEIRETDEKITELGYIDMPENLYDEWIEAMNEEIERRKRQEQ